MERFLVPRPVYEAQGGTLVQVGFGITHYRFHWYGHLVGERLRHELIAAGLPPSVMVVQLGGVDENDEGEAEIRLPFDDESQFSQTIAATIDQHEGTQAADHIALVEFTGSVHEAVRELQAGGSLTQEERDILLAVSFAPR